MKREKFNFNDISRDGRAVFERYGIKDAKEMHKHTHKHTRDMSQSEYQKFYGELYKDKK